MNKSKQTVEQIIEQGKFYFLNEKYDKAIKEFKEALKLDKDNTEVLYSLGIAYESLNNVSDAAKVYLRTLEIYPEHKLAKEHLDKLLMK